MSPYYTIGGYTIPSDSDYGFDPELDDNWVNVTAIGDHHEVWQNLVTGRYMHRETDPPPGIRIGPGDCRGFGEWIDGEPAYRRDRRVAVDDSSKTIHLKDAL